MWLIFKSNTNFFEKLWIEPKVSDAKQANIKSLMVNLDNYDVRLNILYHHSSLVVMESLFGCKFIGFGIVKLHTMGVIYEKIALNVHLEVQSL